MAADVDTREQRLRKQAELQSLYINLVSLRKQENSYIMAQAVIPERLTQQINETQQEISGIEQFLAAANDESAEIPGRTLYQDGFEAEIAGDFESALKTYKSAARYDHPDATAAIQSLRYRLKSSGRTAAAKNWAPVSAKTSRRFSWGIIPALLIVALIVIFVVNSYFSGPSVSVISEASPAIADIAAQVTVIAASTPTPLPSNTPILLETPTVSIETPTIPAVSVSDNTNPSPPEPVSTPTPAPTLRPAPKIIGPSDGLVWTDGAVVFEFENLNLAYDELYCLDTMRGYDGTLTENWSFPPVGNDRPSIAIEANVFRIAALQDISCITWSAYIGKESCSNAISEDSPIRVIGLPRPCNLK